MSSIQSSDQLRLRVVVCGTTFGQFYMRALSQLQDRFQLAGILSRGSAHSRACADRYGIPLWTDIRQVADVDLACVVVRSGVMGGAGSELAQQLLQRRIHVLQEAPVHHAELAASIRSSRRNGAQYRIADLYGRLPAVEAFTAAAHAVLQDRKALFVDATCSSAVLCPLLHILSRIFGGLRPWCFDSTGSTVPSSLRSIVGEIAGLPFTLRVNNEVDASHPDNRVSHFHRIEIGAGGGRLVLTDSHGLVQWMPILDLPPSIFQRLDFESPEAAPLGCAAAHTFFRTQVETFREILETAWPHAIGLELLSMRQRILNDPVVPENHQTWLAVSQAWQDLTTVLGYPENQPLSCAADLDYDAVSHAIHSAI